MRGDEILIARKPRQEFSSPDIWAAPGKAFVLMDDNPENEGTILLPDKVAKRFAPDSCRVLVSGIDGVNPGDWMAIHSGDYPSPGPGKYITRAEMNGWQAPEGSVCRFLGSDSYNDAYVECDPTTHLLFKIDMETFKVEPTGFNVIAVREPLPKESTGGVILTERSKRRGGTARVLEMGPAAATYNENVRISSEVFYHAGGSKWVDSPDIAEHYDVPKEDLIWFDIRDVYAVIG